jgi:hypothetical protein
MRATSAGSWMPELPALDYLGAHLEEALATDGRVAEQGVHVEVDRDALVVRGTVSTPDRRVAIDAVAREVAPDVVVRNETTVVNLEESDDEELVT